MRMLGKKLAAVVIGMALTAGSAQAVFADSGKADNGAASAGKGQHTEWKAQTAALKSQLVTLRAEQQALANQIKSLRTVNKSTVKAMSKERESEAEGIA